MTFFSLEFIFIFLPCFFTIFSIFKKYRKEVLLIASCIFYYFASDKEIIPLFVIVGVLIFNYTLALIISSMKGKGRTIVFSGALIAEAAMLLSPKVISIFIHSLSNEFSIVVPIGMSFYMFKNMSYLREVYDKKIECEKSFISLGAYTLNFAQIISGPIQTYSNYCKSIKKNKFGIISINSGLYEFVIGLSLKILLADKIIKVWNGGLFGINTIGVDSISTPLAWLGFIAFPLYLYFEFYGYSLMSRGICRMMGYETPDNFLYPYVSRSVTEFWRRWHMTLGEWFKTNVYFPLGGNRCSKIRMYFNLLAVWICTGVWHALCFDGIGINFMLWAGFLFVFIVLEKSGVLNFIINSKVLSHVYLPAVILFSWVLFNTNLTDLSQISIYVSRLFAIGEIPEYVNAGDFLYLIKDVGYHIGFSVLFLTPVPRAAFECIKEKSQFVSSLIAIILFWMSIYNIVLNGANVMVY